MHKPTLVDRFGIPLLSAQERCNQAWKEICKERKLDWESVEPAPGKGFEYFTALPMVGNEEQQETSN